MTCIIGLEHDGKVYMGGDSAAVSGWDITPTAEPKVFWRFDGFLIGYTTSFRMGQLLQYDLTIPKHDDREDMRYLVTQFIPAVRECLRAGGFTKIVDNQEEGGLFLVGYRGKVYEVDSEFQVLHNSRGVAAIGCGASYAIGALAAMPPNADPHAAIIKALEIAGTYSAAVCAPYYCMEGER